MSSSVKKSEGVCPWCVDAVMTPSKMTEQLNKTLGLRLLIMLVLSASVVILLTEAPALAAYVAMAIAMICIAVVVHEGGHLLAALRGKVKVTEFAVGFGMPLAATTFWGIIWSIRAIPMGGFCSIIGMDGTTEVCKKHRAEYMPSSKLYIEAPFGRRLWISVAGVVANFLGAWLAIMGTAYAMMREPSIEKVLWVPFRSLLGLFDGLAVTFMATMNAISKVVSGKGTSNEVGSVLSLPGQISDLSGEMTVPVGVLFAVVFAAISLSLVALNIMPLYPLDGSHTVTALADWVRTKRAERRGLPAPRALDAEALKPYRIATSVPIVVFIIVLFGKDLFHVFLR